VKKEWAPQLLSVLRIVVAFLFFQVGSAKWFGFPAAILPGGITAPVGSLIWFAPFLLIKRNTDAPQARKIGARESESQQNQIPKDEFNKSR